MENENLFELQMCQGLILLILQSLKLNIVETINLKKKKTHGEKKIVYFTMMEVITTMSSINNNGVRDLQHTKQ